MFYCRGEIDDLAINVEINLTAPKRRALVTKRKEFLRMEAIVKVGE